jgi:hypothetical protein
MTEQVKLHHMKFYSGRKHTFLPRTGPVIQLSDLALTRAAGTYMEGSRVSYVCRNYCGCLKWAQCSGRNCVPRNLELY